MTPGFDPSKDRCVGTFVSPIMTDLWIYEGELDEARKVLTLDTEGPSFADDGTIAPYKDSIEIVSDDHWVLKSRFREKDGNWKEFMQADYYRIKIGDCRIERDPD